MTILIFCQNQLSFEFQLHYNSKADSDHFEFVLEASQTVCRARGPSNSETDVTLDVI